MSFLFFVPTLPKAFHQLPLNPPQAPGCLSILAIQSLGGMTGVGHHPRTSRLLFSGQLHFQSNLLARQHGYRRHQWWAWLSLKPGEGVGGLGWWSCQNADAADILLPVSHQGTEQRWNMVNSREKETPWQGLARGDWLLAGFSSRVSRQRTGCDSNLVQREIKSMWVGRVVSWLVGV